MKDGKVKDIVLIIVATIIIFSFFRLFLTIIGNMDFGSARKYVFIIVGVIFTILTLIFVINPLINIIKGKKDVYQVRKEPKTHSELYNYIENLIINIICFVALILFGSVLIMGLKLLYGVNLNGIAGGVELLFSTIMINIAVPFIIPISIFYVIKTIKMIKYKKKLSIVISLIEIILFLVLMMYLVKFM